MHPITNNEFKKKSKNYPSIQGRWSYYKFVIDYIVSRNINSCLEIGPGYISLFYDSDILDCRNISTRSPKFLWDIDIVPWTIEDKAYDFLIALHVWEHLKKPIEAFNEARRISRGIILALPYKWTRKSKHSPSHWYIDEEKIYTWTGLFPSALSLVDFMAGKKKRTTIICIYDIV